MRIYCDLDGVLVDLNGRLSEIYGIEVINGKEFVDYFYGFVDKLTEDERIDFWSNLPPKDDWLNLWNCIKDKNPYILTSCSDSKEAAIGKANWCAKYLDIPKNKVYCVAKSKLKKYFALKGNILIDDLNQNIIEWNDWGGTGILHTSARETIPILETIF